VVSEFVGVERRSRLNITSFCVWGGMSYFCLTASQKRLLRVICKGRSAWLAVSGGSRVAADTHTSALPGGKFRGEVSSEWNAGRPELSSGTRLNDFEPFSSRLESNGPVQATPD